MSKNLSPKKNSITSLDKNDQLSELYREAYDRLQSGGTGAGWSGIHYGLIHELRQYGKAPNTREEAIRMLKQLLRQYEKEYLGAKDESDEDLLSRYEDKL